jgi:hypothetical protein
MQVVSLLENADGEFSVQDIVRQSKDLLRKGFNPSHAAQVLQTLAEEGLIYKRTRGAYGFAVPMLANFILRQSWNPASLQVPPNGLTASRRGSEQP